MARPSGRGKGGTLFGKPRGQVIKHPGAFKAKAKAAGMSTGGFAQKVLAKGSKASPQTRKQAGLAKAFATMRSKRGSPSPRRSTTTYKGR